LDYKTLDPYIVNADYETTEDVATGLFDTVLCFWVLEHVFDFAWLIMELKRIARNKIIVAVPTKYKYHPAPVDYWRFTAESMKILLNGDFIIDSIAEFDNGKDQGGLLIVAHK
jgi:2-polyprenyl-3-methyl-5-hydroxy-6-metoxy-1,4-benzoquinol methylase